MYIILSWLAEYFSGIVFSKAYGVWISPRMIALGAFSTSCASSLLFLIVTFFNNQYSYGWLLLYRFMQVSFNTNLDVDFIGYILWRNVCI
jgi:hypothetical protein